MLVSSIKTKFEISSFLHFDVEPEINNGIDLLFKMKWLLKTHSNKIVAYMMKP